MTSQKRLVNVSIAFRNIEPTDALRAAATEKITHCLQKYVHHDTDAQVVMKVEKTRQIAELTFHTDGAHFAATEESDDMYATIDKLIAAITRQLSKHKSRITDHHQ